MWTPSTQGTVEENYAHMVCVIKDQLRSEPDVIANLATVTALITAYMDRLNWVGFYILRGDQLVVGPYQGKPACIRIPMGKGVCGTAAQQQRTIRVEDVHDFPGHIACDADSRSEIVLPLYAKGRVYGVLDIDSPEPGRFTPLEETTLQRVADAINEIL